MANKPSKPQPKATPAKTGKPAPGGKGKSAPTSVTKNPSPKR